MKFPRNQSAEVKPHSSGVVFDRCGQFHAVTRRYDAVGRFRSQVQSIGPGFNDIGGYLNRGLRHVALAVEKIQFMFDSAFIEI